LARLALPIQGKNKKQGRVERDELRRRVVSDFARPSALAPFRIRNYRFQWPADLLTSCAFEMEALILGWYVLVETGSVLLLTVFASFGYIGSTRPRRHSGGGRIPRWSEHPAVACAHKFIDWT